MDCLNTFPVQRIRGLCNPQVTTYMDRSALICSKCYGQHLSLGTVTWFWPQSGLNCTKESALTLISSRWLDRWTEKIRATACLFQRQSQNYVFLEASAFDSAIVTQRDQPDVWILTTKGCNISSRWTNCPVLPNTLLIQDSSRATNCFHRLQREDFFPSENGHFAHFFVMPMSTMLF